MAAASSQAVQFTTKHEGADHARPWDGTGGNKQADDEEIAIIEDVPERLKAARSTVSSKASTIGSAVRGTVQALRTEDGRRKAKSGFDELKLISSGVIPLVDTCLDYAVLHTLYTESWSTGCDDCELSHCLQPQPPTEGVCLRNTLSMQGEPYNTTACELHDFNCGPKCWECGYVWFIASFVILLVEGCMQANLIFFHHSRNRQSKAVLYTTGGFGKPDSHMRAAVAYMAAFTGFHSLLFSIAFVRLHRGGIKKIDEGLKMVADASGGDFRKRGYANVKEGEAMIREAEDMEQLKGAKFIETLFEAIPQSILQSYVGVAKRKIDVRAPQFSIVFFVSIIFSFFGSAMTWTSEEEQARKLEHDHAGHAAADDGGDDGRGVSRGASNRGPVVENVLKSETRQRPRPDDAQVWKQVSLHGLATLLFRFSEMATLVLSTALLLCALQGWVTLCILPLEVAFMYGVARYRMREHVDEFKKDSGKWMAHSVISTMVYYSDLDDPRSIGFSCLHEGMILSGPQYLAARAVEKLIFIGLFYLGSALEETAQDRQCAGQHLVMYTTIVVCVLTYVFGGIAWWLDPVRKMEPRSQGDGIRRPRIKKIFKGFSGGYSDKDTNIVPRNHGGRARKAAALATMAPPRGSVAHSAPRPAAAARP